MKLNTFAIYAKLFVKLLAAMLIVVGFLIIPKCTQAIGDARDRYDAGQAAYIDDYKRELKEQQAKE